MKIESPDHIYAHLICRGRNREEIFHWDEDRWLYLTLLRENLNKFSVKLHAWVLMSNHVHLLVNSGSTTAFSDLLRRTNGVYARRFNRTKGRSGAVWQEDPRIQPIVFDDYFIACQLYIELNPVRAALVEDPSDYPWSSCLYHSAGRSDHLTSPSPWYSTLGDTDAGRQKAYRRLLKERLRVQF
jgi:putative transposase